MTILVPTDFSKLSKVAVLYACRMAKKLKAEVILLAVIKINASAASSIQWKKLTDQLIDIYREDADQLIREVRKEIRGKLEISYRHILGYPVKSMIKKFATRNGIDMIMMGTKGATGLKQVVIGSNAAAVVNDSVHPVMVVPEKTEFRPIKKIIYATDLTDVRGEIKKVVRFAKLFNASVHVLHVVASDSVKKIDPEKIAASLINSTRYPKIYFQVSRGEHITREVDAFVSKNKGDILAMFTHQLGFYEKLFGKGITRQFTFHAKVPLLTFNKTAL